MNCSSFIEDQINSISNEHEAGVSVTDLPRKHDVSDVNVYRWKAKHGGMSVNEVKRLEGPYGRERPSEATFY